MGLLGSKWHGRPSGSMLARTCTKCHHFLPASEFYDNAKGLCGKNPACKRCFILASGERSKHRAARRREAGLRNQRNAQHGMDDATFLEFMARGRCDACGTTETGSEWSWHVDHDHSCCPGPKSCGKCVRGLLCHSCNVTLGMMQDKRERLLALVAYLGNRGDER